MKLWIIFLSEETLLYNLLRNGKIKGFKIGSCWKIPKKAVDDYISSESGINT